MSRLLQVSRSGYYKWKKAQATRLRGEDIRQTFLDQLDKRIHDIWEDSDEVYGARALLQNSLTKASLLIVKSWPNACG